MEAGPAYLVLEGGGLRLRPGRGCDIHSQAGPGIARLGAAAAEPRGWRSLAGAVQRGVVVPVLNVLGRAWAARRGFADCGQSLVPKVCQQNGSGKDDQSMVLVRITTCCAAHSQDAGLRFIRMAAGSSLMQSQLPGLTAN